MNEYITARILELKIWLKVSTAMCFLTIFVMGLHYAYLSYQVNINGEGVFWANPSVESQLALLPAEPPVKKARK